MAYVRNRFKELKAEAEEILGRRITYREIRKNTGVSESTISDLAQNRVTRYDMEKTVPQIVAFFQRVGLDIAIGDFFAVTEEYPPRTRGFETSKGIATAII